MKTMGDVIAEHLEDAGRLTGFQLVGDRRWVSGPVNSIRRLFEFEYLKGDRFSARWGWSVDFVPLLSGRKLGWKRTAAKARLDLCIDPIDLEGSVPSWCSFPAGASPARMKETAAAAVKAASDDWSKVTGLADLIGLFDERSGMSFRRFSLANYVQTDLAWGLALVAVGRKAEGERHLDAFCTDFGIDPDDPLLRKAKGEAVSNGL